MAFDAVGDLFVAYAGAGLGQGGVMKITPAGAKSVFVTGLYDPNYLAFDLAGNLFVADDDSGKVFEITPGGAKSKFASGLGNATGIAFQGVILPVPEPSSLTLAALGGAALLASRGRKQPQQYRAVFGVLPNAVRAGCLQNRNETNRSQSPPRSSGRGQLGIGPGQGH
jgi:hypothetical protein